jgi:hypothetical protein
MDIPRSLLHQNRIDYADTALTFLIAGTQKMSLLPGQISVTFDLYCSCRGALCRFDYNIPVTVYKKSMLDYNTVECIY